MRFPFRLALPGASIRIKVTFFVAVLLIMVTASFYFVSIQIVNRHLLDQVLAKSESLGRSIAVSAGYSFISHDILGLDHAVHKVKTVNRDVDYVAIIGTEMKTIVHSDIRQTGASFTQTHGPVVRTAEDGTFIQSIPGPPERFEVNSPVDFMGRRLGTVIIGVNRSALINAQKEARDKVITVSLLILLVGISGSIVLSAFLTRPIRELASGVTDLKEGRSQRTLRIYSADELGRLTVSFNEMSSLITNQQEKLTSYSEALEESYISTVRVVSAALDARDQYTRGHSERVSATSLAIARQLGLSKEALDELEIACLFHDVGKIKTPDAILQKSDRLSPDEYLEMMKHTEYGADILSKASSLHRFIPAVRHHHEWYDGSGYPYGLRGDQIPLFPAIIAVADAFDAMTSDRPYRTARTAEMAVRELQNFSGRQFDPRLVGIIASLLSPNRIAGTGITVEH